MEGNVMADIVVMCSGLLMALIARRYWLVLTKQSVGVNTEYLHGTGHQRNASYIRTSHTPKPQ